MSAPSRLPSGPTPESLPVQNITDDRGVEDRPKQFKDLSICSILHTSGKCTEEILKFGLIG